MYCSSTHEFFSYWATCLAVVYVYVCKYLYVCTYLYVRTSKRFTLYPLLQFYCTRTVVECNTYVLLGMLQYLMYWQQYVLYVQGNATATEAGKRRQCDSNMQSKTNSVIQGNACLPQKHTHALSCRHRRR